VHTRGEVLESKIDLKMVNEAHEFLKTHVENTPLRVSRAVPGNVLLKCENFQKTGSFKIRGALNRLRFLSEAEKKKGVIAASAGNHAQGVALGAKIYGVKATIVMPETAPMIKILATQNYGAEVVLKGEIYDQAYEEAQRIVAEQGPVYVHAYQDARVIAGQGTIGLEIVNEIKARGKHLKQVIVPIGGGGLISGIASVVKQLVPDCEVIGVVAAEADGMKDLKDGKEPKQKSYISTIADGIAVKKPSREMFDTYIKTYVDKIVSVTDNEIAEAIVSLMEKDKIVVEGSGAVGIAAVIAGKINTKEESVVLVSGGNIDVNTMYAVIETGLRRKGRLTRITVIADDLPGQLARITAIVAKHRANILDVMHDRVSSELSVRETRIDLLVETSSFEHARDLEKHLQQEGIRLMGGVS